MARGVRSSPLYQCEEDYEVFFLILRKTMEKYPFIIHSYCLMTTHFHMLITTLQIEIWIVMGYLMQNYAMYFNRKYGTKGHVFDSRYVSRLIEDERYFLEVSRYIHLNPVRAFMVQNPLDYPYSSYRSFFSRQKNQLLDIRELLSYFEGNQTEGYRIFVEAAVSHEEEEKMIQKDMGEDDRELP